MYTFSKQSLRWSKFKGKVQRKNKRLKGKGTVLLHEIKSHPRPQHKLKFKKKKRNKPRQRQMPLHPYFWHVLVFKPIHSHENNRKIKYNEHNHNSTTPQMPPLPSIASQDSKEQNKKCSHPPALHSVSPRRINNRHTRKAWLSTTWVNKRQCTGALTFFIQGQLLISFLATQIDMEIKQYDFLKWYHH